MDAAVVAGRGVTNVIENCRNRNLAALDSRIFLQFSYKIYFARSKNMGY